MASADRGPRPRPDEAAGLPDIPDSGDRPERAPRPIAALFAQPPVTLGPSSRGSGRCRAPRGPASRRDALKAGLTGLAGLAFSEPKATAAASPRTRQDPEALDLDTEPDIDAHSHVWTPDLDRYPIGEGYERSDMRPASFTADELLAACRPHGVGRVNLIQMSFYRFDNAYMLDTIAAHPGRFVGTAIVDPAGPDPAAAMAELAPMGVVAFRVQPRFLGLPIDRWLDHPGYDAMFAHASEGGQAISFLIEPDALPEVDRMCRKYPDAPVIVDHLARIGVDGRFREADVDALCALARHPNAYVKVGAFYALSPEGPPYTDLAPLIRRVVTAYGPDRCMWESDCPFQVVGPHSYGDSIRLIRDRLDFLSDDDRRRLLAGTAEALLFSKVG